MDALLLQSPFELDRFQLALKLGHGHKRGFELSVLIR